MASNIYLDSEAPLYPTGYGTSLALLAMTGMMASVMLLLLTRENKKRAEGKRDYLLQALDADNLGDDDPRFRYAY